MKRVTIDKKELQSFLLQTNFAYSDDFGGDKPEFTDAVEIIVPDSLIESLSAVAIPQKTTEMEKRFAKIEKELRVLFVESHTEVRNLAEQIENLEAVVADLDDATVSSDELNRKLEDVVDEDDVKRIISEQLDNARIMIR